MMPTPDADLRPEDKTIEAANGRIYHYGWTRFVDEVCTGGHCFICGRTYDASAFNDEHVVPDWLLTRFRLHNSRLTLPNGTQRPYGQHKIPCCIDCNSLLGREIEQHIAMITGGDYSAFAAAIAWEYQFLPEQWLALVFLKLHLMDGRLRRTRDRRLKDDATISEGRIWEHFHHLHALVRSIHTGATVGPRVLGTLITFPIEDPAGEKHFDLLTFTEDFTLYVRVGQIGMIHVIDDGGGVAEIMRDLRVRIGDGPFSPAQARELAARTAYGNRILLGRPSFFTQVSGDRSTIIIRSAHSGIIDHPFPQYDLRPGSQEELRELLVTALPQLGCVKGNPTTFPQLVGDQEAIGRAP
jgi:hypothetical protein